jgi:transcriptional regulator with XRE-family HTH domain
MRSLGLTIRTLREARRLSLSDLSSAAGVGIPFLSLLERNERGATSDTLTRIAKALGIPGDLLLLLAGHITPDKCVNETVTDLAKTLDKLDRAEMSLRRKLGVPDAAG